MATPKKPKLAVEGTIGTPPPPGAPIHERNEPLKPELIADQLAKAAANERELAPLKGPTGPVPAPVSLRPSAAVKADPPAFVKSEESTSSVAQALAESLKSRGLTPPTAPATGEAPGGEVDARSAETEGGQPETSPDPSAPYYPAGSETDSPSRGIPHPATDPGKAVSGGFGVGAMEYFALDGTEVKAIAERLLKQVVGQMVTDLRLGIAITYPQVRIRVGVFIDGATAGASVNDMAFELAAAEVLHLEAVALDDPETPPDALRDEAALERPYKRVVQMGMGRTLADREVR